MDLHHAARAVQVVAPPLRAGFCNRLLERAHAADKYVKRLRKLHPAWGDGSLRAASLAYPCGSDSGPDSPSLRECYLIVLLALERRNCGPC